ncbi:MAG TPA: M23 family metallopeptidase [Thermoleophilaceae bacterium]|jgi:murein DD-endopeptidase MepM/ murein hydrolase activator NlpD
MRRGSPRRQHNRRRNRIAAGAAALAVVPLAGLGAGVALGAIGELELSPSEPRPLVAVSQLAAQAVPPKDPERAAASDRLRWPLRGAVTGAFGEGRGGHTHAGIDIPKPPGTPVKAASGGRVIQAGPEDGYGNYVCIAHVKLSTCYAHLQSIGTKEGARVRRGELIGRVGNTGNSGAVHLHFEVRRGKRLYGEPLDPAKYLP